MPFSSHLLMIFWQLHLNTPFAVHLSPALRVGPSLTISLHFVLHECLACSRHRRCRDATYHIHVPLILHVILMNPSRRTFLRKCVHPHKHGPFSVGSVVFSRECRWATRWPRTCVWAHSLLLLKLLSQPECVVCLDVPRVVGVEGVRRISDGNAMNAVALSLSSPSSVRTKRARVFGVRER